MNNDTKQASSRDATGGPVLRRLRERAGAAGVVSYRDFTEAALYTPDAGYYARKNAVRTGRRADADFYTASSLGGGVFGHLLSASAASMLAPDDAADFTLVEIGAEPGAGVFGGERGQFAGVEARPLGDKRAPPARAVVFANEVLDAQPFHRFVFRGGAWRELGVRVDGPELAEVELETFSREARALAADLPADASEGCYLDLSLDAEKFLRAITATPWRGLMILGDYGYDWNDLIRNHPAGTARAYRGHAVSRDLLASPGLQDLTCHVCWDRLERVLRDSGFAPVSVERQEAFFMKHVAGEIAALLAGAAEFSTSRQTLMELLHPAHLGHKFQILAARRM